MTGRYVNLRFSMRTLLLAVAVVAVAVWIFWERPRRAAERQKSSGRSLIDARDKIYLESCFDAVVQQSLVTVLGDSRLTHWGRVRWLALPDKDTILSSAEDRSFIVWNRKDGSIRHGFYDVSFAVYAPTAGLVFFGKEPEATSVWSVQEGKLLEETLNLPEVPRWVTPDGQKLIGYDRRKLTVMPRGAPADSLVINSPGADRVATCNLAGTALIVCDHLHLIKYDLATGDTQATLELPKLQEGNSARACDLVLTPDEKTLFLGDAASRVLEFNAEDWSLTRIIADWPYSSVNNLAYVDRGGAPELWIASSDLRVMGPRQFWIRLVMNESAEGLSVDKFGAVTSVMNGRIVEASGPRPERMVGGPRLDATCFAWSPRGDQIALGGRDGMIVIRNTADWTLAHSWKAHEGWIRRLDWSPRGDVLLSFATDDILAFWNPATGVERHQRRGMSPYHESAGSFDATGQRVAVHAGLRPVILDCNSWETIDTMPFGALEVRGEMQFSRDGQRLVAGGSKSIVSVWDLPAKKAVAAMGRATSNSVHLQLSTDEQTAYACDYKNLDAYDVASGKLAWSTGVHPGRVFDLALHPTRPMLASAGGDGTVALVDTRTGLLSQRLRFGPTLGEIWQVGFSPNGRLLAVAMSNGAVVVIQSPVIP